MYNRELPYLFIVVGSHFLSVRARACMHCSSSRARRSRRGWGSYYSKYQNCMCRDSADTMKRLVTPERYSYKPFQTYNKALRVFLYHIRPSKYVKYTDTMTYGNCHTSVLNIFSSWSTSKLTNAFTFIYTFSPVHDPRPTESRIYEHFRIVGRHFLVD